MADTPSKRPAGFVDFAPDQVRRFWKAVSVEPDGQGWAVRLDGKMPKSPAGHSLVLPTQAAAQLVAEEWAGQGDVLIPATMPPTRLAFTAIDRVREVREAVADEIAAYAGSDAICYLAETPDTLVERQARDWTPWRDWAERDLGCVLVPVAGIVHRSQADESLAAVRKQALALDDYALTGLAMATPLLGSAVLAFAVQRGALSGAEAFDLSRLDEAFTEERWGVDAEAAERTEGLRAEAVMLERWFAALR
ncbi:ATP12 family protein [Brevundimonas sp.]|uniref:ATP12 family chaperone protein n=1 Tax=Brevundimonas sp. TaxID=1871086 RepID=UPI001DFB0231|nr:ATP12 family protein [Brevundimonas sp.]MBA3999120.1 ATPase [Brevundimonas sp.]